MSQPAKVLIKLPSRNRPERFFKALDSIVDNIYDKDNFIISATLDEDDFSMNTPEVIERINKYPNTSIAWGLSTSKINAVNRSVPEDGWGIIIIASDDIFFNIMGFDEIVRAEMKGNFPDGDGYLHFKEKDTGEILNVMTVIDKAYYKRFGYIYHPEYLSVFADNHQMDVAKILGRYKYIPYEIMNHFNPAYGYKECPRDELFDFQQGLWNIDQAKYIEMQSRNFDL